MRMVWNRRRIGSSTTTDTRTERMGRGFGTAVPEERVGLASERAFLRTSALLFIVAGALVIARALGMA